MTRYAPYAIIILSTGKHVYTLQGKLKMSSSSIDILRSKKETIKQAIASLNSVRGYALNREANLPTLDDKESCDLIDQTAESLAATLDAPLPHGFSEYETTEDNLFESSVCTMDYLEIIRRESISGVESRYYPVDWGGVSEVFLDTIGLLGRQMREVESSIAVSRAVF